MTNRAKGSDLHSRARRASVALALTATALASCSSPTEGPDPTAPASVAVEPGTALLAALGDTIELTATVRNGSSQAIQAAVTWVSDNPDVASVSGGRVVALANGTATITASAGGVSGDAAVTVRQAVDTMEKAGDAQGGDVASPLDSAVVVTLLDARGNPIVGASVSFSVAAGAGSIAPASVATDATGSASAVWTLGPSAGLQIASIEAGFAGEATGQFTATGYALEAITMAVLSGGGQSELPGFALPQPIRIVVLDSLGNGVPDMPVVLSVDGDAELDALEVFTDLDGVAAVGLVLGTSTGAYTVSATVPDSMTASGTPLDGSPVTLTAEAVTYGVAPVSALTVGDTVVLDGTGFHVDPSLNSVTVGGVSATIVEGTQTALTIEVPGFGCTPQRTMELVVSRNGGTGSQSVAVEPAGALSLAVGERVVRSDASDFCLQLPGGSDGEYLVGLTSSSWFDGGASFTVAALDSIGPFPAPAPAATSTASLASATDLGSLAVFEPTRTSVASAGPSEFALRDWEAERFAEIGTVGVSGGPAAVPPSTGDVLALRLPDITADACLDYAPLAAEVFSVGARLVLASTEPLPGSLDPARAVLLAAANLLHTEFGDAGIDMIPELLGTPAGWGVDSRITIVLTPDVAAMGVPAFASAVDQLPRTTCPSSDEGHYLYVAIPSAASVAQLTATMGDAPPEIAHEVAHMMQWALRLTQGGNLLPSWIAEGQAELVVEHVGLRLSGLGAQQDLGTEVLSVPGASLWIEDRFDRLARFHGWDGSVGTVAGAPEQCSLFGFGSSVCVPEAAPGAAWSFLRYLSDRFSPAFTGGESGLHQALTGLDLTGDLIADLEALVGSELPELMVEWAATLYADGRLTPAEAPDLQLTSWKLLEMLPAGPKRLSPPEFGFADFTRNGSVVGGGTAYTLVSATGSHGPLAISVGDGAGGAIPAVLKPRVWVVRVR